MKTLIDIIKQHKSGSMTGLYCVCSSHPLVLEASMLHATRTGEHIVIEATSNQVNQDGGYTGMRPHEFRELVHTIADKVGLEHSKIILGGDHLGPNCWQDLSSAEAMQKSDQLISEFVRAGFRKIHLDCSMSCSDDPDVLDDNEVAQRAARLCLIAENSWQEVGGEPPVYIVGTEVPVPGGAHEDLDELAVTTTEAASQTIAIHKKAFKKVGLEQAWQRVIGLVVQPGVEFDHHKIIAFEPKKARKLSLLVEDDSNLVFEAHSTDYQSREHLAALVQNHFAILKVGPWLTFALREACWALDLIEQEWVGIEDRANLKSTLLSVMHDNPKYWQPYYSDDAHQQTLDLQYSLSDRIRYYWPVPQVNDALNLLINNLNNNPPPLTLVSQYMPSQYQAIMSGEIQLDAKELIFHKIIEVLELYSAACFPSETA